MSIDVLTGEVVDVLSDDEYAVRDELETVITRGLGSFLDVGAALLEIRDRRLYRDHHSTFVAYLERQWQLSESRAYQLINAAVVTVEISTVVEAAPDGSPLRSTPIPSNEAQARELTRFIGNPEVAASVLREAEKDGAPTAQKIKAAAKTVQPLSGSTPKASTPAPDERSARDLKIAADAERLAQNLTGFDPSKVDEKTVRRLEAWCQKWRNQ